MYGDGLNEGSEIQREVEIDFVEIDLIDWSAMHVKRLNDVINCSAIV